MTEEKTANNKGKESAPGEPPKASLIDHWVEGTLRFYWPILFLALFVSVWGFQTAKGLKLDANIISLMPKGVASVENLDKVIKKTGGYNSAMVLVESPDPGAAERFLHDLREALLKVDWVTSAEYAEDKAIFERNKLLYVDVEDLKTIDQRLADRIDYEKKHLNFEVEGTEVKIRIRGKATTPPSLEFEDLKGKYQGIKSQKKEPRYFRDESGQLTILVVLPKELTADVTYARQVVRELEAQIAALKPKTYHPEMKVSLGGSITRTVAKVDSIVGDIRGSGIWAITAILLVVVLFYRRLTAIFYIGVPLLVGFTLTFALTKLTLGGLNLITVFLVLILFGLGIDFGIHNLDRYDEVRANGGDTRRALRIIFSRTGRASLLAGITTIVGFFSLMLTDFKAFYEFGFIAGTGVLFTLLSMYIVFPALMVAAEKIKLYRIPRWRRQTVVGENNAKFPAAAAVLLVALLISGLAAALSSTLQFEDDFDRLKTELPTHDAIKDKVRKVFPLQSDKAVIFVEQLEDVEPLVQEIDRIKSSRPQQDTTIEKVRSIFSVVPDIEKQKERLIVIDRIQKQLQQAVELLDDFSDKEDKRKRDIEKALDYFGISPLRPEDLPTPVQRIYTGVPGSGGYLVYIYNAKGTSKFEEAKTFVDDIREIKANGKTFHPATETIVFVDMLTLMKKDASLAIAVVLATVVLSLFIFFRNWRHVLLVITPVTVGMLWMLGIMAWFNIKLNIFNMVVLPTVLGIGIDNAIHIFHRYREEGRVMQVVRTTGGAAFLTTLTTMLGFAGTLTASNQGLQSLGLVACIGLGCCMVTSLTLFPALLQWFETRRSAANA